MGKEPCFPIARVVQRTMFPECFFFVLRPLVFAIRKLDGRSVGKVCHDDLARFAVRKQKQGVQNTRPISWDGLAAPHMAEGQAPRPRRFAHSGLPRQLFGTHLLTVMSQRFPG